jgi:hypothetical protein
MTSRSLASGQSVSILAKAEFFDSVFIGKILLSQASSLRPTQAKACGYFSS